MSYLWAFEGNPEEFQAEGNIFHTFWTDIWFKGIKTHEEHIFFVLLQNFMDRNMCKYFQPGFLFFFLLI